MAKVKWSAGSSWFRWDPHIHTPGTLLNDQFGNDWEGYIRHIETANPTPYALGIADYFTLRSYKEIYRRWQSGDLSGVKLIFPNVELRLTIETKERQGINLHLLVCPDDPDHVERIEEKLSCFRFSYHGDFYPCTDDGLRRLGRAYHRGNVISDEVALRAGCNQFKIELSDVRNLFNNDSWVQSNVLVAVAAGNDGLSGISNDSSFGAQREELGRFAHIVFSGQPKDRLYWLGYHPNFASNGQTPKPCLHGCDAHALEYILKPSKRRYCWIRSELTFDGLRQTLVEPERRVHIGETPPNGPPAGEIIRTIRFHNAPWIENYEIYLNSGLVTIIGAKGSGKTALVDLTAFAAEADEDEPGPGSFIAKAGHLISGLEVEIEWGDDTGQASTLPRSSWDTPDPRVRYLSQQFVERLCAPSGLAEQLIQEIERVIFNAIPDEDRLQCSTFSELREVVLENAIAECESDRKIIREKTKLIAEEINRQKSIPALRSNVQETERLRKGIEQGIAAIPVSASDEKVNAQKEVAAKLQRLRDAIAAEERRVQELRDVKSEVQRQCRSAEITLQALRMKHPRLLHEETWNLLKLRVSDAAFKALDRFEREANDRVSALRKHGLYAQNPVDSAAAVMSENIGLVPLMAENERLSKELGLDQANANRRITLERQLTSAKTNEEKARDALAYAEKSMERMRQAKADRLIHYENVFNALIEEEEALRKLYGPISQRVRDDPRLSKLTFVIQRFVDIDSWANRGENLLDLRKPPFNRRGVLADIARKNLLQAWKSGTPSDIRLALSGFLEEYASDALEALAQGSTPLEFGEWLFSTEHISVRYGIQYEGVDIAHLSPGTRGVVLLTLYLALDEWDLRPLVVDQPEENLDPSSIYYDLVPFFRDAAKRRQIIMVTHNANLVVNTDSDQVIVAEAHRTSATSLPQVRYIAGGLEDSEIRSHICRLLEGGEDAFRKRGQRYGLRA